MKSKESQKLVNPAGPTSGETPDKPPVPDVPPGETVPTLEEALASLGAPQVMQSGHDGREAFTAWLEDFAANNPNAMKTKAQKEEEKKAKEEPASEPAKKT